MLIYAVLAFYGGKLKAFAGLTEAIIGKLFGLSGMKKAKSYPLFFSTLTKNKYPQQRLAL